jgi:hypothetical protein
LKKAEEKIIIGKSDLTQRLINGEGTIMSNDLIEQNKSLVKGMTFTSYQSFQKVLEKYNKETFQMWTTLTSIKNNHDDDGEMPFQLLVLGCVRHQEV